MFEQKSCFTLKKESLALHPLFAQMFFNSHNGIVWCIICRYIANLNTSQSVTHRPGSDAYPCYHWTVLPLGHHLHSEVWLVWAYWCWPQSFFVLLCIQIVSIKVLLCTQKRKVLLCTQNVWTKVLLCTQHVWTKVLFHTQKGKSCFAPTVCTNVLQQSQRHCMMYHL